MLRTRHMRHGEIIDADDFRRPRLDRRLKPAPRRAAKVDDARAFLDETELLVDLFQLVGGAAPIAFRLRPRDIWVIQLPVEP